MGLLSDEGEAEQNDLGSSRVPLLNSVHGPSLVVLTDTTKSLVPL